MTDVIQTATDELRTAFPPHSLDPERMFEKCVSYTDVHFFEAGARGKRWDELPTRFLEFHHDALLFLGLAAVVQVIPAYLAAGRRRERELDMLPTLNDFKDAVNRKGCESIPYESIRRTCTDKGREVDDWCKSSSRVISCDELDPSGFTRKIENVKQKIADLKRERDELSSKVSNAKEDSERRDLEDKKKAKETEVYELEKKVENWESQYSSEKTAINDRIYNGERCAGFREEVAKVFYDAKSSAKSESNAEVKPHAERLISEWEAKEPGHIPPSGITGKPLRSASG